MLVCKDKLMHFPTWVDLKGQDSVPDTVHHVVCYVDPVSDTSWHKLPKRIKVRAKRDTCITYLFFVVGFFFSKYFHFPPLKFLKIIFKVVQYTSTSHFLIFCQKLLICKVAASLNKK